jgi:hypothetical protein
MTPTRHGQYSIPLSLSKSADDRFSTCRPSLFDDFVEYELGRLKKLELQQQLDEDEDSNNNIKSSLDDEQLNNSNALHAN